MTWLLIILAVALLAGLAYYVSSRRVAAPAPKRPSEIAERVAHTPRSPPNARYWGRQLVVPDPARACQTARILDGQSFALDKVPALPLKDCTCAHCACHFEALRDRRGDPERRAGHDRRDHIRFEDRKDRRIGHDRRKSDHYDWKFTV
jgi:hypothetical protein